MRHFLKNSQIQDEEVINLIEEREVIEVGTQIAVIQESREVLFEVVKINGEDVWWKE